MMYKPTLLLTPILLSTLSCTPTVSPSPPLSSPQPTPIQTPGQPAGPKPTSSPDSVPPDQPHATATPIPAPEPTMSPEIPYQVLTRYPANLSDVSRLVLSSSPSSDTLFWFNARTHRLEGILAQSPSPLDAPQLALPLPDDPNLQAHHLQVYSAMGQDGQGLYIATSITDPSADIVSSPITTSQWMPLENYQQTGQAQSLPQVVYGLMANAEGQGWIIVSDETALPVSLREQVEAQQAAQGKQTTLSRIPLQNWQPMVDRSPIPLIKVPHFFQGTRRILGVQMDLNGQGILLSQSSSQITNSQITLHLFENFTPVGSQSLVNLNPGITPRLTLEKGNGHIDWRNGQFTRLHNLLPQNTLTLNSSDNDQYFLDASGQGYYIQNDVSTSTLSWQKVSNYSPEETPIEALSFAPGTLVQSLTLGFNAERVPFLMGLNYTCDSPANPCELRSTREVWIRSLEPLPSITP